MAKENEAVRLVPAQHLAVPFLFPGVVSGIGEHDRIALCLRGILQSPDDF